MGNIILSSSTSLFRIRSDRLEWKANVCTGCADSFQRCGFHATRGPFVYPSDVGTETANSSAVISQTYRKLLSTITGESLDGCPTASLWTWRPGSTEGSWGGWGSRIGLCGTWIAQHAPYRIHKMVLRISRAWVKWRDRYLTLSWDHAFQ